MSSAYFTDALTGQWTFTRTVTLDVAMEGTVQFTRTAPDRLSYLEEGKILSTRIEFTRAYTYVVQGNDLAIFYADGPDNGKRFLYFADLIGGSFPFSGKAEHLCGRDHYTADFTFASADTFFTHYDVLGPEKAHGITTSYRKS